MGGCGEPQNLDNFTVVSRGISRAGPRNLTKFSGKLWAVGLINYTKHSLV